MRFNILYTFSLCKTPTYVDFHFCMTLLNLQNVVFVRSRKVGQLIIHALIQKYRIASRFTLEIRFVLAKSVLFVESSHVCFKMCMFAWIKSSHFEALRVGFVPKLGLRKKSTRLLLLESIEKCVLMIEVFGTVQIKHDSLFIQRKYTKICMSTFAKWQFFKVKMVFERVRITGTFQNFTHI